MSLRNLIKDLCTSVTLCDLKTFCRCFQVPLMYGTQACILLSLTVSSDSLKPDQGSILLVSVIFHIELFKSSASFNGENPKGNTDDIKAPHFLKPTSGAK